MLVVDNGSSYTDELAGFLRDCSGAARASPGDPGIWRAVRGSASYVLSGRRERSRRTNAVNHGIIRHAAAAGKPLLGVCYGAEMLALAAGGTLRPADGGPRRGGARVEVRSASPLCEAGRSLGVFESHRYEIARLGAGRLRSLGGSAGCRHEMVRLGDSLMFGTQFHPEMTPDGRGLIRRFAALAGRPGAAPPP